VRWKQARLGLVPVFLLALVYLYLVLFIPVLTPLDPGLGDDRLFLSEAMRILRGQLIYRDFFDLNFPGLPLFYALQIRLLGARAWIPNANLVCLGMGFMWLSIVISRRLLSGATAYLPGLWFLCVPFHSYLEATHHWYSIFLILTATVVLLQSRSSARLALAGGLCGVASFFSQNQGPFAALGFAVFICWDARRDGKSKRQILSAEGYFLLPCGTILGIVIAYFVLKVGFGEFFGSTALFPIKYWAATNDPNSWSDYALIVVPEFILQGYFRVLRPLFLALIIPWVYIVAIIYYRRGMAAVTDLQCRLIVLLSILGLSLFASIINAANATRLGTVSLPGFIILIWLLVQGRWSRKAIPLLWVLIALLMLRDVRIAQRGRAHYVETPSGRVALPFRFQEPPLRWLAQNTHPGEYVFDAATSDFYFLLDLQNPTRLWWLTSCDFTRPEQVPGVLRGLEEHQVRLILWNTYIDDMGCPPNADHIQPIRDYLHLHYTEIKTFDLETVWERKADSD